MTQDEIIILNDKAADGIGNIALVADYENLILSAGTSDSGNLKIKVYGSNQSDAVFTEAKSVTNRWEAIQIKSYEDGTNTDGDDGIVFTGTDDFGMYMINTGGLKYITVAVTDYVTGKATATITPFTY